MLMMLRKDAHGWVIDLVSNYELADIYILFYALFVD